MSESTTHPKTNKWILTAILVGISVWCLVTAAGWNQPADHGETDAAESHEVDPHDDDASPALHAERAATMPSFYAVIPFALLLIAIAVLPVMPITAHWWESNLNRFLAAVVLSTITLLYYGFLHEAGGVSKVMYVLDHALVREYVPFITLLFSLYTISGGIRIQGDLVARPLTNVAFLAVGGLLASFIGTTGAAMLLIRPLIDTNNERKHIRHTVVFFIFIVCNTGGCLLPIGDPPLFLGYLKGVSFLWTMFNLWLPWALVNAVLLAIYFVIDQFWYFPRETKQDLQRDRTQIRPLQVQGLWPNALLLLGVVLSVALLDSNKAVPFTDWHPWPFLREAVQYAMVALSIWLGSDATRAANRFNYHAILEVAALFVGIFICMQPAIEILHEKGPELGLTTPAQFFWATGLLSAFLDNAPTYVVFFETAAASVPNFSVAVESVGPARDQLVGISLGAVFLGAATYIGNGPNFMVRAIAEQMGVRMPSFFGYLLFWSLPILLPVFWVCTWYVFEVGR